jgi:hypothetical protein
MCNVSRGASTDAQVYVVISGTKGKSADKKLENGPLNFERGKTDTFLLEIPVRGHS